MNAGASRIIITPVIVTDVVNVLAGDLLKSVSVYTIDGKLVRQGVKSAEGLGTGIYIVNGKKVIVK